MDKKQFQKIAITIGLLFLLLAAHYKPLYSPVYDNWALQSVDASAELYLDDTFNHALVAFAAARATNAILSLLQDSELSLPFVTIAVGEVLDPLNDLVERFSWVMLVSLTSIGIQKFLLEISPWLGVNILFTLSLLLFLAAIWTDTSEQKTEQPADGDTSSNSWSELRGRVRSYSLPLARKILFAAVLVRFCVPAIAWVDAQVYDLFLADEYQQAAEQIETRTDHLERMQQDFTRSNGGETLWEQAKSSVAGVFSPDEWRRRAKRIESIATSMISSFLKLIVVFLLQTVLLPILFLWGLVRLFTVMTKSNSFERLEKRITENIIGKNSSALSPPESEVSPYLSESIVSSDPLDDSNHPDHPVDK